MRKTLRLTAATLACVVSSMVLAHGPTPQKIEESIDIGAPVDRVWALVSDFGSVASWNPALKSSVASNGNQQGSRRTLTFENGESIHEDLDSYEADKHELRYRMSEPNVKAIPASSYSVIFKIIPTEKGSKVEWKSRAYRGETSNEPPASLNDEAVTNALQSFFATGLKSLKTKAEAP